MPASDYDAIDGALQNMGRTLLQKQIMEENRKKEAANVELRRAMMENTAQNQAAGLKLKTDAMGQTAQQKADALAETKRHNQANETKAPKGTVQTRLYFNPGKNWGFEQKGTMQELEEFEADRKARGVDLQPGFEVQVKGVGGTTRQILSQQHVDEIKSTSGLKPEWVEDKETGTRFLLFGNSAHPSGVTPGKQFSPVDKVKLAGLQQRHKQITDKLFKATEANEIRSLKAQQADLQSQIDGFAPAASLQSVNAPEGTGTSGVAPVAGGSAVPTGPVAHPAAVPPVPAAPAPQPKALDRATAAQILQEAGGDKSKARLLAQQRGYAF
jgi:hypothetical protein